jgi:putative NADPH-quinone reductase
MALPMPNADGAATAGHPVMRIEPAQIDFPMLRSQQDFEVGQLPSMLVPARDVIVSARHLVIIFPLWHGTMSGLLKAFLEQVMRPGIAMEYRTQELSSRSSRGAFDTGRPDDRHAGICLPMVFSGSRRARPRAQHPSLRRYEACPRDLFGGVGEADHARRQRCSIR